MPIPTTIKYYLSTSSFDSTTFGALTTIPQNAQNQNWGWNVGRNNPPLFCEMNWNLEVLRTSTQWQSPPTSSIPNMSAGGSGGGNCWVVGPFDGEFVPGIWNITMSVKSVTIATLHTGQFIYRFWIGSDISGSNATLVTSSFISSSIATLPSNTTTIVPATSSFTLPSVNMHNEYLFIQTYWSILTSPGGGTGNNNVDTNFVLGSTNSNVNPTGFIPNHHSFMNWNHEDFG